MLNQFRKRKSKIAGAGFKEFAFHATSGNGSLGRKWCNAENAKGTVLVADSKGNLGIQPFLAEQAMDWSSIWQISATLEGGVVRRCS